MKLIFTLIVLSFCVTMNAGSTSIDSLPGLKDIVLGHFAIPKVGTPIGCIPFPNPVKKVAVSAEPLLIVDGVVKESGKLSELDPNAISSINILKEAEPDAIVGCGSPRPAVIIGCRSPRRTVILVTTRKAAGKQVIVKDFQTAERLSSATVYFISASDTLRTMTDENGIALTDKLKNTGQYKVIVSFAGYKTLSTIIKGKEQVVLLEKDVKLCQEVVVVGYPPCVCRRLYTSTCTRVSDCTSKTVEKKDSVFYSGYQGHKKTVSVYPNPVQRNYAFHLELISEQDESLKLNVSGLNGNLVLLQMQKAVKGFNRFSIITDMRWSAGVYVVQLRNEKGAIVKSDKLIIQ